MRMGKRWHCEVVLCSCCGHKGPLCGRKLKEEDKLVNSSTFKNIRLLDRCVRCYTRVEQRSK